MDIDDLSRNLAEHLVGKHLHVAGPHDESRAAGLDQVDQLGFGLRLILLRRLYVVEGDIVVDDYFPVIEMVGLRLLLLRTRSRHERDNVLFLWCWISRQNIPHGGLLFQQLRHKSAARRPRYVKNNEVERGE